MPKNYQIVLNLDYKALDSLQQAIRWRQIKAQELGGKEAEILKEILENIAKQTLNQLK